MLTSSWHGVSAPPIEHPRFPHHIRSGSPVCELMCISRHLQCACMHTTSKLLTNSNGVLPHEIMPPHVACACVDMQPDCSTQHGRCHSSCRVCKRWSARNVIMQPGGQSVIVQGRGRLVAGWVHDATSHHIHGIRGRTQLWLTRTWENSGCCS